MGTVFEDIGITALGASKVYVIFGNQDGMTSDLTNLTGTNGFIVSGDGGDFGSSISGIGDINGDGIDDFIIGASVVY